MSFLVFHMDKFKREAVRGLQSHNQRERKSRSNPDIDQERSGLNYDLKNSGRINFMGTINRRLAEVNLAKKPRHDAILMCGLIVSSDLEFFQALGPERTRVFFETCTEYLTNFVGAENVIAAVVHLDEKTPHLHFSHVPLTPDGRLHANGLYTRASLKRLQAEFPKFLQGRGFAIERGVEQAPGAAKVHLATREFKQQQEALKRAQEEHENETRGLAEARAKLESLSGQLEQYEQMAAEAESRLTEKTALPEPGLFNARAIHEQASAVIQTQREVLVDQARLKARNAEMEIIQKDVDKALAAARAEGEKEAQIHQEEAARLKEELATARKTWAAREAGQRQVIEALKANYQDYQRLKALEAEREKAERANRLLAQVKADHEKARSQSAAEKILSLSVEPVEKTPGQGVSR